MYIVEAPLSQIQKFRSRRTIPNLEIPVNIIYFTSHICNEIFTCLILFTRMSNW